jgi:hypothetical protein
MMPLRCEHDVMIVNPASAPKSHICELCRVDLVSKDPAAYHEWLKAQPAEKFTQGVESFPDTKPARRYKRVRCKLAIPSNNLPERYVFDGVKVIDTFGATYAPMHTSVRLPQMGLPRLWTARMWPEPPTVGRELDRALNAARTRTSTDALREFDDDGNSIGWEPTQSLTMNVTSSVPVLIETVVPGQNGSPAHSYIEAEPQNHYAAELLKLLPGGFSDKSLGIHNRTDAFVLHEVVKGLQEFHRVEPDGDGVRDERAAAYLRSKWRHQKHFDGAVTRRMRALTAAQIRRHREIMQTLNCS